jgi:hypothetical protein
MGAATEGSIERVLETCCVLEVFTSCLGTLSVNITEK